MDDTKLLYIVIFFFNKRLKEIFDAGELVKHILNNPELDDTRKVDQILTVIEGLNFNDITFKMNENRVMERKQYTRDLFAEYDGGDFEIKFSTELTELDLINGCILFELYLN